MTARGGHALAFLLLASLLGASAAASNGTVEPFIGDTPTVDKQLILDQGEFPAARPPLWRFRTLDTATEATCQKKGNGWKLTVKHKDLKGITPPMMVWLYKNLASGVSVRARARAASRTGLWAAWEPCVRQAACPTSMQRI
jgi:hypothetical protein